MSQPLTLRAVGGLTTAEIAHAVSGRRPIFAGSHKLSEERAQRLRALLHVLYLIFNEGYTSSAGPLLRRRREDRARVLRLRRTDKPLAVCVVVVLPSSHRNGVGILFHRLFEAQ